MAALVIVTGYTLDQRGREGRAVSRGHPRAGRRAALCDRQRDLRREPPNMLRLCAQGYRPRAMVLHLHHGARRNEPDRLRSVCARQDVEPDSRRLKLQLAGRQAAVSA